MSIRHLAPALFVIALVGLLVVSFFNTFVFLMLSVLGLIYLLVGFCIAVLRSRRYGVALMCVLPFICLAFHISYGAGTLAGVRYLFKDPSSQPIREGLPTA
jgi:hypothetical protein